MNLKPGFQSNYGSNFHAYIAVDCDPRDGNKSSSTGDEIYSESIYQPAQNDDSRQQIEMKIDDITIYPNPSNGDLTVVFPKNSQGSFQIVNALGILIQENKLNTETVLISLEKGIYYLRFQTKDQIMTKQIIVL